MASICGFFNIFNMIMQVGNEHITAVRIAYGDGQMKPVDKAGVPTGDDTVVGKKAIEKLVRRFLNPIDPLSPPMLLPNDRFRICIGGSIAPSFRGSTARSHTKCGRTHPAHWDTPWLDEQVRLGTLG